MSITLVYDRITISIVSHGQAFLIRHLLSDLAGLSKKNFEVVITINIPEDESAYQGFPFPLRIIHNKKPKGFGANHNTAFSQSKTKWFAVVNPDIRINSIDFETLLAPFVNQAVAAVAPVVLSVDGRVEDSFRRFPTLMKLANRVFFRQHNPDYKFELDPFSVDWVAGMFVVFRRDAYHEVGGFDDRRFFMYFEDADICRRIRAKGLSVIVNPKSEVVHMAQRASHRNLKHMCWHVVSAIRYLTGI